MNGREFSEMGIGHLGEVQGVKVFNANVYTHILSCTGRYYGKCNTSSVANVMSGIELGEASNA